MELLQQHLNALSGTTNEEIKKMLPFFEPQNVHGRTLLLSIGEICPKIWFVGSGSLRAYYDIEEKKRSAVNINEQKVRRQITNWIVPAGGILTNVTNFFFQTPSFYNIETLESSKLYGLTYGNLRIIQANHPQFAFSLYESSLLMADLRIRICNLRHPEERLILFEQSYPTMRGSLSINILASYLNIDPTTLSRIRSKLSKKNRYLVLFSDSSLKYPNN